MRQWSQVSSRALIKIGYGSNTLLSDMALMTANLAAVTKIAADFTLRRGIDPS